MEQSGKPWRLLTPEEVAERLQISVKSVYRNSRNLGGFYPAGIKVLRFREETIRGLMARQAQKGLAVQLPASGQDVRGRGFQNQSGGQGRTGGASEGHFKPATNADPNRHGLLDHIKRLSGLVNEEAREKDL